jgi:putative DNA primase/helicase
MALPSIFIQNGRLPEAIDKAESALMAGGVEVFSRDGVLTRPYLSEFRTPEGKQGRAWRMEPVSVEWLVRRLTCCAHFYRWDKRVNNWILVDCPDRVAKSYLYGMGGEYKLPKLVGVVTTPYLRPDGSLCDHRMGRDDRYTVPERWLRVSGDPECTEPERRAACIDAVR